MTTEGNSPDIVQSEADGGSLDAHAAPASSVPDLPAPGEVIIEVQDIGKSYGSVIALRDVTTTVLFHSLARAGPLSVVRKTPCW